MKVKEPDMLSNPNIRFSGKNTTGETIMLVRLFCKDQTLGTNSSFNFDSVHDFDAEATPPPTSSLLVIIHYLSYFVLSIVLCSCCVRGQCQFATCPVFPLFSFPDLLIIAEVISSVLHLDLVINGMSFYYASEIKRLNGCHKKEK